MKVLVTGATGFVGSHLTDHLEKAGHQVFSLVRNLDKAKLFDVKGTLIEGSLHPTRTNDWIAELPFDLDAVVHTAGVVHSFNNSDFFMVNSESTRQLIEDLSIKYNKIKFILISSLAAAGPSKRLPDEQRIPEPVSDYGRSKLLAERILSNEAPSEWRKIIVRPPMVIGPRDPGVLDVFKMVNKGLVPAVGTKSRKKKYSFVSVFDLVETILLTLTHDLKENEIFYSSFPKPVSFERILSTIANRMEKKNPRILPLPLTAAKIASKILSMQSQPKAKLTPDKLHEITPKAWTCSSEKSCELLGQDYKWDLDKTIEVTLEDYRKRGWLN